MPPFIEYSNFASLGFTLTFVNALCACPLYVPLYGVALKLIVPFCTVAVYVAVALVTVIVALPAVVPDFTVTVFPLTLAVAILLLFEETLNAPVFPLTVNVPLFGYVYVPLVADNVNFPSALLTFTVSVVICVL